MTCSFPCYPACNARFLETTLSPYLPLGIFLKSWENPTGEGVTGPGQKSVLSRRLSQPSYCRLSTRRRFNRDSVSLQLTAAVGHREAHTHRQARPSGTGVVWAVPHFPGVSAWARHQSQGQARAHRPQCSTVLRPGTFPQPAHDPQARHKATGSDCMKSFCMSSSHENCFMQAGRTACHAII